MAERHPGQEGRGREHRQPGQPADGRQHPHPRPGCVGPRVLPAVPEPPSGLHRRVLQRDRLERSRAPLPGSDRLIGVAG
ncbi:hypothetical protein G6F68_021670 [Rhizopus microsporus]|nr:hypothetical protein G6F68_021670 [Rhizopus microsporus]